MFESSVEERYKNNATFRNLVDILRAELRRYDTTPRELREAAMLAATMHESQHIKPMLISVDELRNPYWEKYFKHPAKFGNWEDWESYFEYPAMFGGAPKTGECGNTAAGAQLPRSPNAYDLYAPNKKKHPITKIYQHNFSIVRYSDNQKPSVYYVCSKCGLSDTYVSTLEYKTCEKF